MKRALMMEEEEDEEKEENPRDLLRSRALLYLVSKASAPDWEYRVILLTS